MAIFRAHGSVLVEVLQNPTAADLGALLHDLQLGNAPVTFVTSLLLRCY
jgi:hypothetical protein